MSFLNYIRGYRTYIVAGLLVLVSLVHLISGDISFTQFLGSSDLLILLNGLGLGALRAGLTSGQ